MDSVFDQNGHLHDLPPLHVSVFCTSLLRIFVMSVFFGYFNYLQTLLSDTDILRCILFKHFFLNHIKYVHGWVKIKAPLNETSRMTVLWLWYI